MWSRILQNVQKHNKTFKLYVLWPFLGLSKVSLLCLQALNILASFLVSILILNLHNPTLPLFDVSPLTGYHKSRTSVSQTLTFLTADITLGNYATPCVIKSGRPGLKVCVVQLLQVGQAVGVEHVPHRAHPELGHGRHVGVVHGQRVQLVLVDQLVPLLNLNSVER